MPEIAEVKIIGDNIRSLIAGKKILSIDVDRTIKWATTNVIGLAEFQTSLPAIVISVHTHGKMCWIDFGTWKAMIQFGMSGNIRLEPTDEYLPIFNKTQQKPVSRLEYMKHCHISITYEDSGCVKTIYYHDIRRFGRWTFINDMDVFNKKIAKLGSDPLSEVLTDGDIVNKFRTFNHKNICKVLMDQGGVFAGVGNYIKSETLYAAKICPLAIVKDLEDKDLLVLYSAIQAIAKDAYSAGGASLYTYTGMNGDRSEFKNTLQIYGKPTDPQGRTVVNIPEHLSADGRSTWWVPEVQIIGAPNAVHPAVKIPSTPLKKIIIKKLTDK